MPNRTDGEKLRLTTAGVASTFRPGVGGAEAWCNYCQVPGSRIRLCPRTLLHPCPARGSAHARWAQQRSSQIVFTEADTGLDFALRLQFQWSLGYREKECMLGSENCLGEAETTAGLASGGDQGRHHVNQRKTWLLPASSPQHPAPPLQPVRATWQRDRENSSCSARPLW